MTSPTLPIAIAIALSTAQPTPAPTPTITLEACAHHHDGPCGPTTCPGLGPKTEQPAPPPADADETDIDCPDDPDLPS